jgi:hypothetical protein
MTNVHYEGDVLGRLMSCDEIRHLMRTNPDKIIDDILASGACGGAAVMFKRPDGSFGIEDAQAVEIRTGATGFLSVVK